VCGGRLLDGRLEVERRLELGQVEDPVDAPVALLNVERVLEDEPRLSPAESLPVLSTRWN